MRVGIDIGPAAGTRTGVGMYCHNLLRAMLETAGPGWSFHGYLTRTGRAPLGELEGRLPVLRIPVPTRAMYAVWRAARRPRVDALLGGVDVCHGTNYFMPPVKSARRVLSIYDLSFLRVPEYCSPKIVSVFSAVVPRFARQADAIVTCSEAAKGDIVELLEVPAGRVHVAHGAVEEGFGPVDRAAARAEAARHGVEGPFILFTGTLEPRKNVAGLLRAFDAVAGDIPHQLVLVGGAGWRGEQVEFALSAMRHRDRVLRLGYLPSRETLSAFYSAADLFAFPTWYEGFGLPVLEAMACGCPVVSTQTSSIPEVTGDAGVLVPPGDTAALANAMRDVLRDTAARERMSAAGIARARTFTWQNAAECTLEAYRSAAS